MNKSILKPGSYTVTPAPTQHTDRTILDLEIYLTNSNNFRSCIYDHREVKSMAERFGLSPDRIRSELRRLGYQLTNNGHGRMIWKSKEGEHVNYAKKIASLEEYISKCEARQLQFYDRSEIGRIAKRSGVDRDSVRAVLRRRGYRLSLNAHDITVWVKRQEIDTGSLISGAFAGSVLFLGTACCSNIYACHQFLYQL